MPAFTLAFLWGAKSSPEEASELTEQLSRILPPDAIQSIQATVGPAEVNIQLIATFSAYPRATMDRLIQDAKKASGELVELWRLPKSERDRVLSRYFTQNRMLKDCQSAAKLIRETLAPNQPAKPKETPAAGPSRSAGGSSRVISLGPDPAEGPPRAPRYDVSLDVEFQTELEFVQEHATNISNGGLFVRTPLRPEVDSEVAIRIKLPNGEVLESSARVAHVKDDPKNPGVGLEFKSEDPVFRSALDAYLASLA